MSITVYTVLTGGFDILQPPRIPERGVRYLCYADRRYHCPPWEVRPAYLPFTDSRRNSRIPKILSHFYTDTEYSIYHDASCVHVAPPSKLIEKFLSRTDLTMYCHPRRSSLYQEREACIQLGVCSGEEIDQQIERYRARGIGPGLWSAGIIFRRNTPAVQAFNELWWKEYKEGCYRDQIALPCAIQESGIAIETINRNINGDVGNFHFHAHLNSRRQRGKPVPELPPPIREDTPAAQVLALC